MSAAQKPVLEMQGIKLRFDDHPVLDGVDLTLQEKETLVVMGASGSGKSTLLRLVLGLLEPDSGTIRFRDKEITGLPRRELNQLRESIGMVYQESALISSMSVHDNIALPLRELSDKSPEEIESVVTAKLDQVGLADTRDKLPSELSGGMKKRVSLARALALDPTLVLYDEPTSGLDPVNARLVDDTILSLRKKHDVTSIVVTHQMQSAFYVATRMAMLDGGKIVQDGSPEEFLRAKAPAVRAFVEAYRRMDDAKEPDARSPE